MKRSNQYFRQVRKQHIGHKIHILKNVYRDPELNYCARTPGVLSKGKIHCSCWICRNKSYDVLKISEVRKNNHMNYSIKEYYELE